VTLHSAMLFEVQTRLTQNAPILIHCCDITAFPDNSNTYNKSCYR